MGKKRLMPALLILLAVPLALLLFSGLLGGRVSQETLALTRESVRRAAVQCYALEGAYPRDFAYLQTHYGISVDEGRFRVDYVYIGSNLMPDITVIPLS